MATVDSVLVVAAERRELAGLTRNGYRRLGWQVEFAAQSGRWVMVANGAGPLRSAEAVDVALRNAPVMAIVSAGYCGALEPDLSVAEIVAATEVNGIRACVPASGRKFALGPVLSLDRVVQTASEKARLHQSGAIAVEMEAAGVAERAAHAGLPFYCVRVVTDGAGENLANDFNAARDAAGRIRQARVLLGAVSRSPWERLPELLKLARRSRMAARALGEFLEDCRIG